VLTGVDRCRQHPRPSSRPPEANPRRPASRRRCILSGRKASQTVLSEWNTSQCSETEAKGSETEAKGKGAKAKRKPNGTPSANSSSSTSSSASANEISWMVAGALLGGGSHVSSSSQTGVPREVQTARRCISSDDSRLASDKHKHKHKHKHFLFFLDRISMRYVDTRAGLTTLFFLTHTNLSAADHRHQGRRTNNDQQ
jgi:hypothetical protein